MAPLDFNKEIRDFVDVMVNTLPKSIALKLDLADDLFMLNGDKSQLGQVILNLAINAKDAMPEGGELAIATKNIELEEPLYYSDVKIGAGRYVAVKMTDTGCGIQKADLDHIFEPFYTTKEAGQGTGIGLSVVLWNRQKPSRLHLLLQ